MSPYRTTSKERTVCVITPPCQVSIICHCECVHRLAERTHSVPAAPQSSRYDELCDSKGRLFRPPKTCSPQHRERETVASLCHTRKTGLACVLKHCRENASRSHSTVCKSQEHLYQDKEDENNLLTSQTGKLSQCLSQHNVLCFSIKLQ